MNRYEVKFYNRSLGSYSTVIVFGSTIIEAVFAFVDNRYGSKDDIISVSKKDKAV